MKKILMLLTLSFAAMQVTAATVDATAAQSVAQRFLQEHALKGRLMTSAPTVKWTHEVKNSSNITLAAYYIVNTDCGYVIVAGDDRAREILAYGDGSLESISDLPENMRFFLDVYQQQMGYLQAHPGMVVQQRIISGGVSVDPLLTTTWAQGRPYFNQTPVTAGAHCQVGSSAVSLAQVMNYWEYPQSSPALLGYTSETYEITVGDLPAYIFDWANMRDVYKNDNWSDAERDAVSYLMRYVGQAEKMDYGTQRSDADEEQIFQAIQTFGYDLGARYVTKQSYKDQSEIYSDEEWATMIQDELVAGRPLIYCAFPSTELSDANRYSFNVDGYDAYDDTYHVNFGSGASYNGYFALNAFSYGSNDYKYYQLMFVGLQPMKGDEVARIEVSPATLNMETNVGQFVTATFNVTGYSLTDDITVTVQDKNGVFRTDVSTISVDEADNKTVTVTYSPRTVGTHNASISLNSDGVQEVRVVLNGTATAIPLTVYDPVMLAVDSAAINLTSFRADWTDETVADNVASYTLEVSAKPTTNLLAEADWTDQEAVVGNQSLNAADYLPEGWEFNGNDFYLDGGSISLSTGDYIMTNTLDLTAYDNLTVVVRAKNFYDWKNSTVKVETSADESTVVLSSDYADYTIVLDGNINERVKFTASDYPYIQSIKIYGGNLATHQLRAAEVGDSTYRLVTGITDKSYTVNGLTAGGTFYYKVKAQYINGTESGWSNVEQVTLFSNDTIPVTHILGDVNHDGEVSIKDATALIDYLLGDGEICEICADVNGKDGVTIADVTALLDLLLGNYETHIPGDVNHDGEVSIKDVTALLDYLLGEENGICLICADVNGKDGVTVADITALIDVLLEGN